MKKILQLLCGLCLLLPLAMNAQDKNEELMDWASSRRLTWSDYKANPNPHSDAAASTTTLIGIEYKMANGNFNYNISCKFSLSRSWGLHKTEYILAHEQGHFDIAEIFARKLHKAMSEYSFNSRTYQKDLKKIYQDIMQEKEDFQNTYDRETNHSIKKDKQAQWLVKIAELLEEYKSYAGYNIGSSTASR
jgi:hypothetical protein